jgi:midasin (ATPase involved in ribosome maturation)
VEEGYLVLAARVRNMEEDQVILNILEKVFKRKADDLVLERMNSVLEQRE